MQHRGRISGIACLVIAAFTATPAARADCRPGWPANGCTVLRIQTDEATPQVHHRSLPVLVRLLQEYEGVRGGRSGETGRAGGGSWLVSAII
jgi:hypothetical protein